MFGRLGAVHRNASRSAATVMQNPFAFGFEPLQHFVGGISAYVKPAAKCPDICARTLCEFDKLAPCFNCGSRLPWHHTLLMAIGRRLALTPPKVDESPLVARSGRSSRARVWPLSGVQRSFGDRSGMAESDP